MIDKFIEQLKEVLEYDGQISVDDSIREIEGWDSLAQLSLIALIDEEYGVVIDGKQFSQIITVGDLAKAISENK